MAVITVLLPIYNGAAFLEETLQSLKQQSFPDFEVLCIDDCSTDDSAEIVRSLAAEDGRFVYLHTGSNLGSAPKAINFAAPQATGTWFVYSSQDDLFSDDWLAKLHHHAVDTGADAVLPDVVFYHSDETADRTLVGYHGDRTAIVTGKEAFVASLDWSIAGNALWPMSFLKSHGFEEFGAFADEYTVRSFFLRCGKVAFCDGVFFYRQDNAAAITKKPSKSLLESPDANLRLWNLVMDNQFGPDVHGPLALRVLRGTIRAQALIINHPHLAPEGHLVDSVWATMQSSDAFQASLASLRHSPKHRLRAKLVCPAARSRLWFLTLARLSAFFSRNRGPR